MSAMTGALAFSAASLVGGLALALSRRRVGRLGAEQLPLPGFEKLVPGPKGSACAVVVQVGKVRPSRGRPRVRGFRACLTRTQFERLFPGVAKLPRGVWPRARCGLFGCVYPRGLPGTSEGKQVIKFTNDEAEAVAAERLRRNPVSGALRIFDVYKLRRHEDRRPVWAIRSNMVAPTGKMARALGYCGHPFVDLRKYGGPHAHVAFMGCVDMAAQRLGLRPSPDEVEDFVMKFLDTVADMQAQGIVWMDLHPGNVTQDESGNPVILDIGPYLVQDAEETSAEISQLARSRR